MPCIWPVYAARIQAERKARWHPVAMHQIRGMFWLDLALLALALRTAPYVNALRTWMYGTATQVAVGTRASMYVRCHKAHSRCVQRCVLLARLRTATQIAYAHMRQCTAP